MRFLRLQRGAACAVLGGLAITLAPTPSAAQGPVSGAQAAVEAPAEGPLEHFKRALELYRAGQYAEALLHLQSAAELDPNGKDLFFNLALVHEKLGQLPQAIAALERFRELEPEPVERERARLTIERLHGAYQAQAAQAVAPVALSCPKPPPAPPAPPARPTAVLVGAASLAVVSVVVGAAFGLKALSDEVGGTGTSVSLPLSQLRERGRRAEREALVADVAFALGAASAGLFAGVWWLSPTEGSRSAGITLKGYF